MAKIREENLLDKYEEDHSELVKEACEQIRIKVEEESKKERRMKRKMRARNREHYKSAGEGILNSSTKINGKAHHRNLSGNSPEHHTIEIRASPKNQVSGRKIFEDAPSQKAKINASRNLYDINLKELKRHN